MPLPTAFNCVPSLPFINFFLWKTDIFNYNINSQIKIIDHFLFCILIFKYSILSLSILTNRYIKKNEWAFLSFQLEMLPVKFYVKVLDIILKGWQIVYPNENLLLFYQKLKFFYTTLNWPILFLVLNMMVKTIWYAIMRWLMSWQGWITVPIE